MLKWGEDILYTCWERKDIVHTCGECNKHFTDLSILKSHIRACTSTADALYSCTICCTWFCNFTNLKAHLFREHSSENNPRCSICCKQFTHADLKRHMRVHSHEPVNKYVICDEQFALNHLLAQSSDNSYSCFVCGIRFNHTRHLNIHLLLHTVHEKNSHTIITGVIEGKCLDNHMLTSIGKKLMCSACGQLFTNSDDLKLHVRVHIEETNSEYICGHCGKEFTKALLLKMHMHIHILIYTGEKGNAENSVISVDNSDVEVDDVCDNILTAWNQIKCELCNEQFADRSSLADHILSHPRICCTLCDKQFLRECDLKHHLKLHIEKRPEVCGYCGALFKDTVKFNLHISLHKCELRCSVCGERFRLSSDLKHHMEMHGGKRSEVCLCCGQVFSDALQFSSHMLIHKHDVIDMEHAYSQPKRKCNNSFAIELDRKFISTFE